jgi:septal ring factor EnvC (AmiA/AmiB activator)
MTEDNFNSLKQFSQELLNLGQEIEQNLTKKQDLESQIKGKDNEIRRIQQDIYTIKSELRKVEIELGNLENKRKDIEAEKNQAN